MVIYTYVYPITAVPQKPPTYIFIHVIPGTQGLSKMKRNHIHLAQGVAGKGVISGNVFFFPFSVLLLT